MLRSTKIKQMRERFLQARAQSDSDPRGTAIGPFIDYYGRWKIMLSILMVAAIGIAGFETFQYIFFREKPYNHEFDAGFVGFKKPRQVLMINTTERRQMIKDAIEKGYVSNQFDLDPMKDEGLYLSNTTGLELLTTVRKSDINKMRLVPLAEPIPNDEPLQQLDAMAYFGPRALEKINSDAMVDMLVKAENVIYKNDLANGGMLSLLSSGKIAPYLPEELDLVFERIIDISEGVNYLKAQVDINDPNAPQLLAEYQATEGSDN